MPHTARSVVSLVSVLSTPREQTSNGSSRSTGELVRDFLDKRHGSSYMIYSLDQYSSGSIPYRKQFFSNRVRSSPRRNNEHHQSIAVLFSR
jgi:hypothetical protein